MPDAKSSDSRDACAVKFGTDCRAVRVNGTGREHEPVSDLAGTHVRRDESSDFDLSRRKVNLRNRHRMTDHRSVALNRNGVKRVDVLAMHSVVGCAQNRRGLDSLEQCTGESLVRPAVDGEVKDFFAGNTFGWNPQVWIGSADPEYPALFVVDGDEIEHSYRAPMNSNFHY
jgi:hypothetical protein